MREVIAPARAGAGAARSPTSATSSSPGPDREADHGAAHPRARAGRHRAGHGAGGDPRARRQSRRVDRHFVARGPLVNRLITGRIRRWFQHRRPAPALARAARRRRPRRAAAGSSSAHCAPAGGQPVWSDAQLDRAAAYRARRGAREDAAVAVQEIVGRLFHPRLRGRPGKLEAARADRRFPRRLLAPCRSSGWITGRLRRARRLLLAGRSRTAGRCTAPRSACTASSHALDRMRDLRAAPDAASLGEDRRAGTLPARRRGRCRGPSRRCSRRRSTAQAPAAAARSSCCELERGRAARARRRDGVHARPLERAARRKPS